MVEMVEVNGVLVRSDELDQYVADHAPAPVRYVKETGPRCVSCGSYGVVAQAEPWRGERRTVRCGGCDAVSVIDPATGEGYSF